ncbi:YeiH family protein [Flavobacterium sp. xlx-221]|uniref:YeiH family protein n=1 Tax=unclassified Flavobacterium TaxID=196869 RepID=UPI002107B1FE|nr:putative sulfate exporter family transporter [Flavobacterium sp. xlx-221]
MKMIHSVKGLFQQFTTQKGIFLICAFLCLMPFISSPIALVLGFAVAQIFGNPYEIQSRKVSSTLLKVAVVGLGFGMNVFSAIQAGKEGIVFTVVSISTLMILGFLFTKIFKIEKTTGYLISAGTAICGGSAIAAIAPITKAKPDQISVALAVVFTLNSVALLIFPPLGHLFNLSQHEFGLWCAIAIHDTSSVVGAASKYGEEALQVATTVKLARALWIIPLSFLTLLFFKNSTSKLKIPWFIALFLIAICINTYVPFMQQFSSIIITLSKSALTLTLFLIGTSLSFKMMKTIGYKPLLMAIFLWIIIGIGGLIMILNVG